MRKTIIVFANSVKHGKHCVAGKCIATGQWVRPVSDISGTELRNEQSTYTNKYGQYMVKPKQKIEMNFQSHAPLLHQPDNYLIDNNSQWQQRFKIEDNEISQYLDTPTSLWGKYNHIPYSLIASRKVVISQSLYLIQTENLTLYRKVNKRRASFNYNGIKYDFPVTDPNFDKITAERNILSGILCISLGEEFNGNCYKIVATIL